jgi:hypothetical protein
VLGRVHKRGMGLLWGWGWPIGSKLIFDQTAAPVQEIMDTTLYEHTMSLMWSMCNDTQQCYFRQTSCYALWNLLQHMKCKYTHSSQQYNHYPCHRTIFRSKVAPTGKPFVLLCSFISVALDRQTILVTIRSVTYCELCFKGITFFMHWPSTVKPLLTPDVYVTGLTCSYCSIVYTNLHIRCSVACNTCLYQLWACQSTQKAEKWTKLLSCHLNTLSCQCIHRYNECG